MMGRHRQRTGEEGAGGGSRRHVQKIEAQLQVTRRALCFCTATTAWLQHAPHVSFSIGSSASRRRLDPQFTIKPLGGFGCVLYAFTISQRTNLTIFFAVDLRHCCLEKPLNLKWRSERTDRSPRSQKFLEVHVRLRRCRSIIVRRSTNQAQCEQRPAARTRMFAPQ